MRRVGSEVISKDTQSLPVCGSFVVKCEGADTEGLRPTHIQKTHPIPHAHRLRYGWAQSIGSPWQM